MKVKTLIKKLKKLDPNLEAMIDFRGNSLSKNRSWYIKTVKAYKMGQKAEGKYEVMGDYVGILSHNY